MGGSHLSIKKNLLACRESDSRPGARPRNMMSWSHTEECCFFGKTSLRRVALIFFLRKLPVGTPRKWNKKQLQQCPLPSSPRVSSHATPSWSLYYAPVSLENRRNLEFPAKPSTGQGRAGLGWKKRKIQSEDRSMVWGSTS